jgi:hypothetical protein
VFGSSADLEEVVQVTEEPAILVLRDEAGDPYLLPRQVVEQEELVAFRVGEDEYLLPRKTLLGARMPGAASDALAEIGGGAASARLSLDESSSRVAEGAATAEALSVRAPDGAYFLLGAETLERARVHSEQERAAVEQALDADVEGYARAEAGLVSLAQPRQTPDGLSFAITRLGVRELRPGRGFGDAFVS